MTRIADVLTASTLPALETRMLLMHALKKTRVELITHSDYILSATELETVQQLIRRRLAGEPVAYLLGEREFFGLMLHVTPDVLIPRPDSELLVELALQRAPVNSCLLDLGTGSGALAIALAHERADLQVWAGDISPGALAVAQSNARLHDCQIEFILSDWYAALPAMQWHTIVSNPPYIVQHDPHLTQGDLRYEPIDALTDHADGLSAYRLLLDGAGTRLLPGGWLLVEHGYHQAEDVRALFACHPFEQIQSWRDLGGIERVTGGQLIK